MWPVPFARAFSKEMYSACLMGMFVLGRTRILTSFPFLSFFLSFRVVLSPDKSCNELEIHRVQLFHGRNGSEIQGLVY